MSKQQTDVYPIDVYATHIQAFRPEGHPYDSVSVMVEMATALSLPKTRVFSSKGFTKTGIALPVSGTHTYNYTAHHQSLGTKGVWGVGAAQDNPDQTELMAQGYILTARTSPNRIAQALDEVSLLSTTEELEPSECHVTLVGLAMVRQFDRRLRAASKKPPYPVQVFAKVLAHICGEGGGNAGVTLPTSEAAPEHP